MNNATPAQPTPENSPHNDPVDDAYPGQNSAADDSALLDRIRAGELDYFEVLWDRHYPGLLAYAARRMPASEAEDCVSDSMEAVLRATAHGKGPHHSAKAYMYRTLRREMARRRKSDDHQSFRTIDEELEIPMVSQPPVEQITLVRTILARLGPQDSHLLQKVLVDGAKPAEIADAENIAPEKISTQVYLAKRKFRQQWFDEHVDLTDAPEECAKILRLSGRIEAGSAGRIVRARYADHVDDCEYCTARIAEAGRSSRRLAVLFPAAFGIYALAQSGHALPALALGGLSGAGAVGAAAGAGGAAGGSGSAAGGSTGGSGGAAGAGGASQGLAAFTQNPWLLAGAGLTVAGIVGGTAVAMELNKNDVHEAAAQPPAQAAAHDADSGGAGGTDTGDADSGGQDAPKDEQNPDSPADPRPDSIPPADPQDPAQDAPGTDQPQDDPAQDSASATADGADSDKESDADAAADPTPDPSPDPTDPPSTDPPSDPARPGDRVPCSWSPEVVCLPGD